jgi:homopolymeric O-antigen transport system permease protein
MRAKVRLLVPSPETIYTSESPLRHPGQLLRSMLRDLLVSRELGWRLLVRNLRSQYRQSLLGYLWAFLPPLFMTLAFVFLSQHRIVNIGTTPVPYPAYVLVGSLLWQGFVDALYYPLKLIASSKSILTKVNFPREALILAGLGEVIAIFAIRIVLMLIAFVWFQIAITATALLALLPILSLLALGCVIGIVSMPLGVLYHDVERGLSFLILIWFFVTPVVYPTPTSWPASILVQLNPVTPLLNTARELLTGVAVSQMEGFFIVSAIVCGLALVGWVLYRITLPHLIERMGS